MQIRHIIFTVLLLSSISSGAQKWFPVGATWSYTINDLEGADQVRIWVQKDTVVNGTTCKLLNQAQYSLPFLGTVVDTTNFQPLYAYERNDSVYFLQGNSFVLVYNLNMHVGDSSNLADFYIDTNVLSRGCVHDGQSPAPYFSVNSIDSITVGGQVLKVFNDTLNRQFDFSSLTEIERVGSGVFIIPQIPCEVVLTGNISLSCYSDSVIGTYRVPNAGPCNPFSSAPLTIGFYGYFTYCPGTVIRLNAGVSGGVPPYSYQWSVNGGGILSCDTCANPLLTVDGIASVYVTVTDANNDGVEDVTHYSTSDSGVIHVTISGNTSMCQGATDILSVAGNYSSYVWSTGDTTSSVIVNQTGNYIVTVTSGVSCTGSGSISVNIASNPAPQSITGNPSITSYQEYTYAVNQVSGISYRWLVQGGAIQSGQGTNAITVLWGDSSSNMITLIQINTYGCADTATLQVLNTGIQSLNDNDIKLYFYAAPENNIIRVVNSIPRAYTLSLFDISGRMVFNCKSRSDQNILPGTLSPGAYIARLNFPGGIIKNLKILIR